MTSVKAHTAHLFAVFTILCWGTTIVASKQLLAASYSPLQIMVMRFLLAAAVTALLRPRRLRLPWREELRLVVLSFFGCTLYFLCENSALLYTLSANVAIILAAAPIFTALLAHLFTGDERMRPGLVVGFLVAMAGVVLVVFNGTVVLKLNPLGDFLAILAALCWAVYSVLLKPYTTKYDPVIITRKTMVYGLVTALPFLLLEGKPFPTAVFTQPVLILCILFLGLLGSGICYVLWTSAMGRLGVVTTNNYIYVMPFVTMVAAFLFLREGVSWMGAAGAVLTVAGVIIADRPALAAPVLRRRHP